MTIPCGDHMHSHYLMQVAAMVYAMFQAITLEDTDLLLSSSSLEVPPFQPLYPSLVSSLFELP